MSQQVSNSFVRQYESQAHLLFQRKGSKLRMATRYVPNVVGRSTTFQRVGTGQARGKGRNGLVPLMNQDHTPIECTLEDRYAADLIDVQDLEKLSIDEKDVTIRNGANAIGRTFDGFILDAMDSIPGGNTFGSTGTALTLDDVKSAYGFLGDNNALEEDEMNYAIVSHDGWNQLLDIDQFSDADYVGDRLPFNTGPHVKYWLGTYWMTHTGIKERAGSGDQFIYWWNKMAVGSASGSELKSVITYENTYGAYLANSFMSMGSCIIDATGVARIRFGTT